MNEQVPDTLPSASASPNQVALRHPAMLNLLVFVAGMVTLGVELSAARLLDPYFGNSILVWAALIGLVLACLSLGYWLGGRLADRRPSALLLYAISLLAAVLVGLIPVAARPILQAAALSSLNLENVSLGLLLTAGASLFLLLSVPTVLLGTISPFSIRLALSSVQTGGQVAGRLYALSTVGSLLGTFLPILILIPAIGTRLTFVLLGAVLAATAVLGLFLEQPRSGVPALATLPFLALLGWLAGQGAVKPEAGLIHEGESLYNYYQVLQKGPETWLKLNEGIGLHSVYHPQSPLSEGIWDYFLVAPLFAAAPPRPDSTATQDNEDGTGSARGGPQSELDGDLSGTKNNPDFGTGSARGRPQSELGADLSGTKKSVKSLYLVGLAGGTIAQLYSDVYGPIPIDGVELDPAILEAAETYFHLGEYPNINGVAADGRNWLMQQPAHKRYSVIGVDAYRPPYIPFHLATVEFFELVRQHLDENGVVAVNAARSEDDYSLVQALASTMAQVFPSVYVVDESTADYTLGNSLLVATVQPTTLDDFKLNAAAVEPGDHPILAEMVQRAQQTARPAETPGPILTDDRAPIEQIIHGIMLRYLLAQ